MKMDVPKDRTIEFTVGPLAFEEFKKFAVIDAGEKDFPFKLMQSLEEESLGFIITEPFIFNPEYDFELGEDILQELKIEEPEDIMVYVLLVIPEKMEQITANMAAPIILNINKKLAKQVILEGAEYPTKYLIFQDIPEEKKASESC